MASFGVNSTTLVLNGEVIKDFISGDFINLDFLNPETTRTYGANGAVNVVRRADANVATLTVRVMKFSDNDIWFNEQINADVPVVFNGSLKEVFVKDGSESVESYELLDGTITTKPNNTKNNQDGNTAMEIVIECFARRLI